MKKINNSILFMACLREALATIVENSEIQRKEQVKNFVLNEATDYQLLSMAVTKEIPKEKNNFLNEMLLIEEVKNSLKSQKNEDVKLLVSELHSIRPYGLSSSNTFLGNISLNDDKLIRKEINFYSKYLSEGVWADRTNAVLDIYDKFKYMLGSPFRKVAKDIEDTGSALDAATKKIDEYKQELEKIKYEIENARAIRASELSAKRRELDEQRKVIFKRLESERAKKEQLTIAWIEFKRELNRMVGELGGKVGGGIKKVVGNDNSVSKYIDKMGTEKLGYITVGVAGAIAAAAVIYAGSKIYQRFLSQAAKACSNKSFGEKTQCMKDFRKNGYSTQLSKLKQGIGGCNKSKDPELCKTVVQQKIVKVQQKLKKLS